MEVENDEDIDKVKGTISERIGLGNKLEVI